MTSFFLRNGTARFFIGAFAVVGIVLLLMQLKKHVTNKVPLRSPGKKEAHVLKSLFDMLKSAAATLAGVIATLVSGPALFIIIVGHALLALLSGVIGIVVIKKIGNIYNDIINLIEPLLEKLASTGENKVIPSIPYYLTQTSSLGIVLFYTVALEAKMKKRLRLRTETEIRYITDEIRPFELGEDTFEKASRLIARNGITEQLRINADKEFIANVVNNCQVRAD